MWPVTCVQKIWFFQIWKFFEPKWPERFRDHHGELPVASWHGAKHSLKSNDLGTPSAGNRRLVRWVQIAIFATGFLPWIIRTRSLAKISFLKLYKIYRISLYQILIRNIQGALNPICDPWHASKKFDFFHI